MLVRPHRQPVPISVPFVWLLLLFRCRYRAYDPRVFVTYSMAFVTLLVVTVSIGHALGLSARLGAFALAIVLPLHMYRQLKQAHDLSNRATASRAALLLAFAALAKPPLPAELDAHQILNMQTGAGQNEPTPSLFSFVFPDLQVAGDPVWAELASSALRRRPAQTAARLARAGD